MRAHVPNMERLIALVLLPPSPISGLTYVIVVSAHDRRFEI
jgi:hypothetical protein